MEFLTLYFKRVFVAADALFFFNFVSEIFYYSNEKKYSSFVLFLPIVAYLSFFSELTVLQHCQL
jgi:hypothetical protein